MVPTGGENKLLERKAVSVIALILLLLVGVLTLSFKTELVSAIIPEYPAIYVDPPIVENVMPGSNVTVSIKTDYSGYDIWAWQFTLSYNPSILHGVEVRNGDLITTEKDLTAMFVPGTFDNTLGTLSLTWAVVDFFLMMLPSTTYGPGTLAYVTFTVVGYGTSNITLGRETKLIGYDPILEPQSYSIIDAETMPHHIQHGYFSNKPTIHDVAVTNVMPNKHGHEKHYAYPRWTINVNVTVLNNGTEPANMTVSVYYNEFGWHEIGTQTLTNLAPTAETTVTFSWNLARVNYCNHTIKANATLIGFVDVNPANNEGYSWVKVKMPGDVDGDGDCDSDDVLWFVSMAYGSKIWQPRYNQQCDFDGDGDVDADDVFLYLSPNYGKKYICQ